MIFPIYLLTRQGKRETALISTRKMITSVVEQVAQGGSRNMASGYLSVLLASAMFGSVFTVAKLPLGSVNPLVLSALTYTISGLSLIPFARGSFRFQSKKEYIYLVLITALGGIVAPTLLLFGLQDTSA